MRTIDDSELVARAILIRAALNLAFWLGGGIVGVIGAIALGDSLWWCPAGFAVGLVAGLVVEQLLLNLFALSVKSIAKAHGIKVDR